MRKSVLTKLVKRGLAVVLTAVLGSSLLIGCGNQNTFTTAGEKDQNQSDGSDEEKVKNADGTLTGKYNVEIVMKDLGTIYVELDADAAPATVTNFVKLAEEGFYDGLTFHRIIKDFMIQGGDPLGNGYGGSDTTIVGEFTNNNFANPLSHTRGAISMARANDPNSASSQFFIVHKDSTFLDGDYAVFGYVTEGMDIVDTICENTTGQDGDGIVPAENQPIIEKIKVVD